MSTAVPARPASSTANCSPRRRWWRLCASCWVVLEVWAVIAATASGRVTANPTTWPRVQLAPTPTAMPATPMVGRWPCTAPRTVMRSLLAWGNDPGDPLIDTMLAAYLLDPSDTRYDLVGLAGRYADIDPPSRTTAEGQLDLDGDGADPAEEAAWAALAVDPPGRAAARSAGRAGLGTPQRRGRSPAGGGLGPHGACRHRGGPLGAGGHPRRACVRGGVPAGRGHRRRGAETST